MDAEQRNATGDQPLTATIGLWTVKEAGEFLKVSERYLRDSSCPRLHLPGKGAKGQPMVRFVPAEVMAWADKFRPDGGVAVRATPRPKAA